MIAPIIVLEGLDACGKTLQTELLIKRLQKEEKKVSFFRFPGYTKTIAGKKITEYLKGKHGDFKKIDPRIIANLYAADRLMQVEEITKTREKSDIVLLDRGVTSNLIYTPARGETETEKQDLLEYIKCLEYKIFGFPQESLVIFLQASQEARKKIHAMKKRQADIHEQDENYLKKVEEMALDICKKNTHWKIVKVDKNGDLRDTQEIADEIYTIIKSVI